MRRRKDAENMLNKTILMGRLMAEKIPDAGLVVEEGAGHFAYLEQSAKFLRIAGSFLLEGR